MPYYSYSHTFKAHGSKLNQEELEMPCYWGILTDVIITFPPGCHGYVHVHIDDGLHQVFPTNAEETIALDAYTLPIRDEYELLPDTRKIYLRGWNEGNYDHKITVSFTIRMTERLTKTETLLNKLLNAFKTLTGYEE
jgi:hypothetical protein